MVGRKPLIALAASAFLLVGGQSAAFAADYPAPKQGEWIARDFKFHTGEVMPALKLHYTTVGDPAGQPVLVLHGTGGSAASMLTPGFAGEVSGVDLTRNLTHAEVAALEAGMRIDVTIVDTVPRGVDTPADLETARQLLKPHSY